LRRPSPTGSAERDSATGSARHPTESELERDLCGELRNQEVDHEHRSLRFRIKGKDPSEIPYRPAIVVRRGQVLFLIEAIPSEEAEGTTARILSRFLEQHSSELVLVVVAPRPICERFPADAYDEIYAADDLARAVRRVRDQATQGIVEPFTKLRPE